MMIISLSIYLYIITKLTYSIILLILYFIVNDIKINNNFKYLGFNYKFNTNDILVNDIL